MDRYKFIWKSIQKHGYRYNYTKVDYINAVTKVCIICPIHGEFWQKPVIHVGKHGCPMCANKNMDVNNFIEKARKVHGDKYDYSKVEYINSSIKICIVCSEHGEFWQTPHAHLSGQGCPQERYTKVSLKLRNGKDFFVEKAKEIHGDIYDYSKVEYKNNKIKVCIICPKHGEFWQAPSMHLSGNSCPKCGISYMEREIKKVLQNNQILFEEQKTFDWLKHKKNMYLDFYLPDYNIAIECQGGQHFKSVNRFGGLKTFEECVNRDIKKFFLCKKNNINILYYTNINDIKSNNEIYNKIINNIDDLILKIKENDNKNIYK